MRTSRLRGRLAAGCLLVGMAGSFGSGVMRGQASNNTQAAGAQAPASAVVEIGKQRANSPVNIAKVFVGRQQITPGNAFGAADDWLSQLKVSVENRSLHAITALHILLAFAGTGDGTKADPLVVISVVVGDAGGKAGHSPAFSLAPNVEKTLGIALGPEDLKRVMEKRKPGQSIHCTIQMLGVSFDDGGSYFVGHYQRPDPANAGKVVMVPEGGYLPGK